MIRKSKFRKKATYRPSIHLTQSDKETYVYQDKLPKQPISSLSNTGTKLKRTLDALETHPSFGTDQINRLKSMWDTFAENEGPKIDEILRINDSKQRDSFVHELWTTMYLADRVPILMNYNPSIAMTPPDPSLSQAQPGFPGQSHSPTGLSRMDATGRSQGMYRLGNPFKQSALVLSCIAKYYCALRDGHLPALGVNMGKHFVPLDMSQFKNLGWFYSDQSIWS